MPAKRRVGARRRRLSKSDPFRDSSRGPSEKGGKILQRGTCAADERLIEGRRELFVRPCGRRRLCWRSRTSAVGRDQSGFGDLVNSTQYLFCYGTLLRDTAPQSMAALCRRLPRVAAATINGRLYDLGSYPALVLGAEGDQSVVRGEIVAVQSASDWLRLDSYESVDHAHPERSLYNRVRTTATTERGDKVDCWIYVYNRELKHAVLIDSGCWRTHLSDGEEFVAIPC